MIRRVILSVLAAAFASACGSAGAPVVVPGSEATIPKGALRAIQARWPGAELGSSRSATCPGAAGAPATMITGDLDGNGSSDAALWITVGGVPRLVAVLARLNNEYNAVDFGHTAAGATGEIEVARRGTPYRTAVLSLELHYGVDTLVVRGCDGARTAYFWSGNAFRPEALAR